MTTTVQTDTVILPPDLSLTKTEVFDVDFATWILNNKDISREEREAVRRIHKARVRGNQHEATYKLGKDIKHEHLGRFCVVKGQGLQALSRDCRAALAQRYYWDIDIRNAQPTLLQQYAEKRGWVCSVLKRYNENRDDYIVEVEEALNLERWEAKQRITALFFGGSHEGLTTFFAKELHPELRKLMENIWNENKSKQPSIAKKPNPVRSLMAFVLQTEERQCLMAMDKSLASQGRSLDVLIHDGGLVRKKDGEGRFPEEVLRRVERDVLEMTGYTISLAVKDMKTTLEREDDEGLEYEERKRQFEETGWKGGIHFKLRHPPCFIALSDGAMEQMSKGDLEQNEQNNVLGNGVPFTKKWLTDPNMKEYRRVVFLPKQDPPEGCFNLWRGFPNEPKQGDFSVFQEVLRIIANGDQQVFDYIENYFASIIQRPHMRTNVSIVVQGEQGVGKDSYFNAVGYGILGTEYYHSTKTPENDVFAKFNSIVARKLVIKFEEADFKTNKENASKLKGIITEDKTTIEKKNKDPIVLDNYTNILMTTNNDVPIVLEETDRRFVLIQASSEKRGNAEFWNRVHRGPKNLHDPEACSAYHHYLLTKDISQFDPRNRPITQFYKDVKQSFIPYHARFFQRTLELDPERTEPLEWSAHRLFAAMKTDAPASLNLSETRFGRDLRLYDGVVDKVKQSHSNLYRTEPAVLRTFLVQKGWWVDY